MPPITVLHIDAEGGWGGSSRSLFELISRLDRSVINPVVVYRESGPARTWYWTRGVKTFHVPEIASFVPRRRPFIDLLYRAPRLLRLRSAADKIAAIAKEQNANLIHLNYEGLFLLGRMLKQSTGLPVISHCRAMIGDNMLGQWLARTLGDYAEMIYFISENERDRFLELTSPHCAMLVMPNIARTPMPRNPADPPEVLYIGNIAKSKGALRIPAIAAKVAARTTTPFRFVVCGKPRGADIDIAKLCEQAGVSHLVDLRGHLVNIDEPLSKASILIRPSLEGDPWGRDIIDAMAAGVPIVATGTFDGFIGESGILASDDEHFAAAICSLLDDPKRREQMSEIGQARAQEMFSGNRQAETFTANAQIFAKQP